MRDTWRRRKSRGRTERRQKQTSSRWNFTDHDLVYKRRELLALKALLSQWRASRISVELHLDALPLAIDLINRLMGLTGLVYSFEAKPSRSEEYDHWMLTLELVDDGGYGHGGVEMLTGGVEGVREGR
jgi:hypothetical protein